MQTVSKYGKGELSPLKFKGSCTFFLLHSACSITK